MEQIIRNMKHLEYMYSNGISKNAEALFNVQHIIAHWEFLLSKVKKQIEEMENR